MKPEQREFLNLRHFPGVLSRQQAAWRLGVEEHEIDILASAGRVTALGKPKKNGKRVFANVEIDRLIQDQDSMHRNQRVIIEFWERKNASRLQKDDVAITSQPSVISSKKSPLFIQKNSPQRERKGESHAGKQKPSGRRPDSSTALNGFHDNGHFNNSTSSNE